MALYILQRSSVTTAAKIAGVVVSVVLQRALSSQLREAASTR